MAGGMNRHRSNVRLRKPVGRRVTVRPPIRPTRVVSQAVKRSSLRRLLISRVYRLRRARGTVVIVTRLARRVKVVLVRTKRYPGKVYVRYHGGYRTGRPPIRPVRVLRAQKPRRPVTHVLLSHLERAFGHPTGRPPIRPVRVLTAQKPRKPISHIYRTHPTFKFIAIGVPRLVRRIRVILASPRPRVKMQRSTRLARVVRTFVPAQALTAIILVERRLAMKVKGIFHINL